MRSGCINAGKPWTLFAQCVDQVFDPSNDIARILTERDPEDTVTKGLPDTWVVAESPCHRGFPIATSTAECCRDRNKPLTFAIQQHLYQAIKLVVARHGVGRQILRHEWPLHMLRGGAFVNRRCERLIFRDVMGGQE